MCRKSRKQFINKMETSIKKKNRKPKKTPIRNFGAENTIN